MAFKLSKKTSVNNNAFKRFPPFAAAQLKKSIWFVGRHAFPFMILFIAINVIVALLMLQYFLLLPQTVSLFPDAPPPVFDKGLYQRVVTAQQARGAQAAQNIQSLYQDPFQ
ncbi:MAG: hypothetical protein ACREHG_10610 [Candidatus Saccharimonadales bacterium]